MRKKQKLNPIEELKSKLIKIHFVEDPEEARRRPMVSFEELKRSAEAARKTFKFEDESSLQPKSAF